MQRQEEDKNRRRGHLLMFYWLGIMTVLLLLVAATYTWFSLSRTPRVNDMDLYVSSAVGLELAVDMNAPDEEWGRTVDFADLVTETSPLKPCTWSEAEQRFYAAVYGVDGRLTGRWTPLTDEDNANVDGARGYYTMGTLYARSETAVSVSLSEAITLLEDDTETAGTYVIGTPVWNEQTVVHDNGGVGAEYAIRIGIRVTPVLPETTEEGEADWTNVTFGDPVFYIYEPNCDGHADGAEGYVDTPSIDGTDTLVPEERLITQTTSSWEEAYPVQRTATIKTMGEFTSDTELFSLEMGGMERIDLYIWLEGQDVDCSSLLSSSAQILANLQFDAGYPSQSGLVPIE